MTALKKYQRLECGGLWREAPGAQRREVTVAFGESSLVLSDTRSAVPLAHWSLPAVARRNPGETPALFSPDPDAAETLELDDPDMIGALETVAQALRRGRRSRPRLRLALGLGTLAALALGLALWLPGALVEHAQRALPQAKRAEIGAAVLADLARAGHPLCGAPLGLRALGRLQERLGAGRLVVLAEAPDAPPLPPAMALPGGVVALGQAMVEGQDSPEVAAGHVLAALVAAGTDDPLSAALRHAGMRATAVLLTTGEVPLRALRNHGPDRMARPLAEPDPATLAARFAEAGISPAAWEAATGRNLPPPPGTAPPLRPVLGDGDWVGLQGICQR